MPAPITLDYHIQPSTIKDGFTQSELSLLDECAKKWNFRYNNLLKKADDFNWSQFIGSAWHMFQQLWRESKGGLNLEKGIFPIIPNGTNRDTEWEKWMAYWEIVMPAYQKAYAKMNKGEEVHEWEIVEKELSFEHLGYRIRGKIDLASTKPKFIRDFKTTVSAWLISPNGWHFKLQFMTYCWLMAKNYPAWAKEQFTFQMDIMQKPGLKETKADGSWAGHIRRVAKDVQDRPEFYLTRQSALIVPDAIQRFEEEVLTPKIQRIALAVENPEDGLPIITNASTNACNSFGNQCEFFEMCEKGTKAGIFLFEKRKAKHEEL